MIQIKYFVSVKREKVIVLSLQTVKKKLRMRKEITNPVKTSLNTHLSISANKITKDASLPKANDVKRVFNRNVEVRNGKSVTHCNDKWKV